jgi:hypothetical protein
LMPALVRRRQNAALIAEPVNGVQSRLENSLSPPPFE